MIPKECRRLAEVDFPIAEVSRHAMREKSIRHGHPSTLPLWWARRPLAACRSMLLGLLLPDPCDPYCPEDFKQKAREFLPQVVGEVGPEDKDLRRYGSELAEELRRVGAEIKEAAEKELAEFYPPDPDGARPVAYLWAWTVRCESPNCGTEIPLVRSFWLCKKANRRRALRYRVIPPKNIHPSHDRKEVENAHLSRDREGAETIPLAYLITFSCYGTWLHGNESGSVDGDHNLPGTPFLPPDSKRLEADRGRMDQPPYKMDGRRRDVVLKAIQEVCAHRGWSLLAAHVRTNHVHVVVHALEASERVMNDFKAYASRRLNEEGFDGRDRKRWTRHGSTRYLWKPEHVEAAIQYVVHEQGTPMAVFENKNRSLWYGR